MRAVVATFLLCAVWVVQETACDHGPPPPPLPKLPLPKPPMPKPPMSKLPFPKPPLPKFPLPKPPMPKPHLPLTPPQMPKWWYPVPVWDTVAVSTAKSLVQRVLGLANGQYILYMDDAQGAWWNKQLKRYKRCRFFFRIKEKNTKKWYTCRAQFLWEDNADQPSFDPPIAKPPAPGAFYNVCFP